MNTANLAATRARIQAWWGALARRERMMVAAAVLVVVVAVLFVVAIDPAARTRARLAEELPRLREQAAEMEAMAQEAKLLKGRAVAAESAAAAAAALQQTLAGAQLGSVQIAVTDERRVSASGKRLSASAWFAWLDVATRETRVRIVSVRAVRTADRGLVDAEATFEIARRP